jgi:hypothetical protein
MERMGHDSTRAALIYLHSSAERQRAIADQVGRNAKAASDCDLPSYLARLWHEADWSGQWCATGLTCLVLLVDYTTVGLLIRSLVRVVRLVRPTPFPLARGHRVSS